MTYRIGIIGGDGIGPEVVAEAMKCVDAAGVALRGGAVRPRRRALPARRRGAPRRRPRGDPRARRRAARRGRARPAVPPGVIERGLLLRLRFELDLYVNLRPFVAGPDALQRRRRHASSIRENTEGTYAGEGGFLRKGTPHEVATQGSVNTRMGVERVRALRVRARPVARAQAPHARAQDQRAHVRRRPLAAHVRRGRRRVPRRRHRVPPRRRRVHLLRAGPGPLRRDRHRQPLRRHPHRPRRRGRRRHRAGGVGQPQPGPHRAVAVRAGARLGARHRRAPGRPIRAPRSSRPR